MKKIIKIFVFIPILSLIFSGAFRSGIIGMSDETFTALVAGFDDAAENTDVLFLLNYSAKEKQASVVQIPRDTYYRVSGKDAKINSIYSNSRYMGHSEEASMSLLCDSVEEIFGIDIDAYIGLSGDAFLMLVDSVGGITMNVPKSFPISGYPINLTHGENVLNGRDSLAFVRHRSTFVRGDLGRMDAQKLFLDAMFKTFFDRIDAKTVISLLSKKDLGLVINFDFSEITSLLSALRTDSAEIDFTFLTIPGEAVESKGIWYYAVNKAAAEDAVKRYVDKRAKEFDIGHRLTNEAQLEINRIYSSKISSYEIYTAGKIKDIEIQ